ncbi:MAG: precorrin-4 C(11)-methyltransferase [Desulfobacterales bacterium]
MKKETYPIVFCGAGPGDPELITVKGQRALQRADLVLYTGSLVPESVLVWTAEHAERISSAAMNLDQIVATLVQAHAAGKRVVRLHTGDPSLYGAIAEQMDELDKHAVPYTVIPGVTAAFAAAASLGIEYTVPEKSQTLILTRMAGRTPVPAAEDLALLAQHKSSMAIYLSAALVDRVAEVLAESYGPDAPCAVAYKVSHPEEKIVMTRAADLAGALRKAGIDRHALILVGPALGRRPDVDSVRSKLYDRGFSHGYRTS